MYIPWPYRIKYVIIISHQSTCMRKKFKWISRGKNIQFIRSNFNRWEFRTIGFHVRMYYSSSFRFELFEMKWNEMETAPTEEKKRRTHHSMFASSCVCVCEYSFRRCQFRWNFQSLKSNFTEFFWHLHNSWIETMLSLSPSDMCLCRCLLPMAARACSDASETEFERNE